MRKVAPFLVCLVFASTLFAQTPGTDDRLERINSLISTVSKFRSAMAVDMNTAVAELGGDHAQFAQLLDSPANAELPVLWHYFFLTAIPLVGHAATEHPLTAYYNPFLDAAVYVRWQRQGENFAPAGMALDARTLAEHGENAVSEDAETGQFAPLWLVKGGTLPSLRNGYRKFLKEFERDHAFVHPTPAVLPSVSNPGEQQEIIEARSFYALQQSGAAAEPHNAVFIQRWEAFRQLLQGDDPQALDAALPKGNLMTAADIFEIPSEVREMLSPVYILFDDSAAFIYLQPESAPEFVAFMSILKQPGLTIDKAVTSFVFINLSY